MTKFDAAWGQTARQSSCDGLLERSLKCHLVAVFKLMSVSANVVVLATYFTSASILADAANGTLEAMELKSSNVPGAQKLLREVPLRMTIGNDLNIANDRHPVAVVVRLYPLKDPTSFLQAPYDTFIDPTREKQTLGADLVNVRGMTLIPGQRYDLTEKVLREATTPGVVALFCSPASQRWKFVLSTKENEKSGIVIGLHACVMMVTSGTLTIPAGATPLTDLDLLSSAVCGSWTTRIKVSYSAKILQGEGLFLCPQHLQRQDTYHESRLHATAQVIQLYAWGTRHTRFDTDALANGVLRVVELSLFFPDGEPHSASQADAPSPPLILDVVPVGVSELAFHITLCPLQDSGGSCHKQIRDTSASRLVDVEEEAADLYTETEPVAIMYLGGSIKLIIGTEPCERLISLFAVHVWCTGIGGFELDESFVAPNMTINASAVLYQRLRRLFDVPQVKVSALYNFRREPTKNITKFRSSDVALFRLPHMANATFATLSHLYHHPDLHPGRLFQEMLRPAGALTTFTKSYTLIGLPAYNHDNPGPVFVKLGTIMHELLDIIIFTHYFAIALEGTCPSFHLGHIDSDEIDDQTSFYPSVSIDILVTELVEAIPARFKVDAPDDVEKLVLSSIPDMLLTYAPQVSPVIPTRPGARYFAVEAYGMLYERMLQAQTLTIYAPAGIRELKLELIAVIS